MTGRHQGGRKGPFGQPKRHQGGRKGFIGQLAKHQGGRKGSLGQPARHQGGRKEPFGQSGRHRGKSHLDNLGGTKEAPGRLVAQDGRSNPGFGRAPDFNTISMAIGPVRRKSWGGLHGWLPVAQTGF